MRLALAAVLAIGLSGTAQAQDDKGCYPMEDALGNVDDILVDFEFVDIGERELSRVAASGDDVADGVEYALYRTGEAAWPQEVADTLTLLGALGKAANESGGQVSPEDRALFRTYAESLAAATHERCVDADIPIFIQPGGLACPEVIELLEKIEKAVPSYRGDGAPMWILQVTVAARDATRAAEGTGWSPETIASLSQLTIDAEALQSGKVQPGLAAADAVTMQAAVVAAEALRRCPGKTIPLAGPA